MSHLKSTLIAAGLALAFGSAAFAQSSSPGAGAAGTSGSPATGSAASNPGKRTDSAPSTGTTSESSSNVGRQHAEERARCNKLSGKAKSDCMRDISASATGSDTSSSRSAPSGGSMGSGDAPGASGPGTSPNTTKPK